MKRKALLICCDNTLGGKLPGAMQDARNMVDFLMSPLGGLWRREELHFLRNPGWAETIEWVTALANHSDYLMTHFSGHGAYDSNTRIQYIELKDSVIDLRRLAVSNKRQLVIMDACRNNIVKNTLKGVDLFEGLTGMGDPMAYDTRELFSRAVLARELGVQFVLGALAGTSAYDTADGGVFTLSLIQQAEIWSVLGAGNQHVLGVRNSTRRANELIKRDFAKPQQGVYLGPDLSFPFAVKL